jgi:2,5-diamino-6-(ribosylamino)-4(3H)-pyrimidinone 5'-phosphate reductase
MPKHHQKRKNNKVKQSLSTRLKEKEERIQKLLESLVAESAKGTPIIVEGKKDIQTLRTLGIEGPILTAKTGGRNFLDVLSEAEKTGQRKVILLLDFDRRGKEWTKRLKQNLETAQITPNTDLWHQLSAIVGKGIKDIESLGTYMETMKKKTGYRP